MYTDLVIGASGFLGKYLVTHLLAQKHRVYVVLRDHNSPPEEFSHKDCHIISSPMEEYSTLSSLLPSDIKLHTTYYLTWNGNSGAARGDSDVQLSNLKGITDAIHSVGAIHCEQFVATGTISEQLILDPSGKIQSQNMLYAAAKHSAYLLSSVICQKYEMDFTWLQLANIYGYGNTTGNLTSYTLETLLQGELPTYSSATVLQDFMYVEDCVEAIALVGGKKLQKNIYYVGSGSPQLLKDYLHQIRDAVDPSLPLGIGARPDDGTFYPEHWFDIQPLQEETGFQPKHTFRQGMEKTVTKERQKRGITS